jgi:hypothetical protein
MTRVALALSALLLATSLHAQTATRGAPLPQPLPLMPADNWWNVNVSAAPVDAQSNALINFIGTTRRIHPDFGGESGDPSAPIYGMPYIVVTSAQPLVPVVFDYDDESDPGPYPIPEEAKTQQRWIEGGLSASDPAADGDRHMLLVDRDRRILYELYAVRWNTARNRWEAGSGAIFPLDTNLRRPDGWTSADAAGLAILPGLVRYDEVYGADPIRHAFRVTVRSTNGYVWPASHRAGSTSGALPMGARLRLKTSVDLTPFPPPVQKILQAMKSYGLIVADNGSDLYVSGTYDTRWDNDLLNPALGTVHASDFEVVQLGWKPSANPPPTGKHRAAKK